MLFSPLQLQSVPMWEWICFLCRVYYGAEPLYIFKETDTHLELATHIFSVIFCFISHCFM